MHSLILRFEKVARANVVLVYLSAMFIATAAYFAGRGFALGADLLYYVAIAEAVAVEVHSFLSQRLTRELHELRHAPGVGDMPFAERDALEARYQLHYRITVALVGFSVLNSVGFWASQMQPASVGAWAQVILRGAVVPLFFLAAGFLVPLHESVEGALQDVGADLIRVMVRHASKQWRYRVKRARKMQANLAEPLAMLLEMQEGGGMPASVMIRTMDAAIRTAEDGSPLKSLPAVASDAPAPTHPTGPGSPSESPVRTPNNTGGERAAPIRLAPVRTGSREDRAAAARAAQAEHRAMRLANILEWMREARAKGKTLSVGIVEMKLRRIDSARISRSTIQSLMRLAEERLNQEDRAASDAVSEEGGQAAR